MLWHKKLKLYVIYLASRPEKFSTGRAGEVTICLLLGMGFMFTHESDQALGVIVLAAITRLSVTKFHKLVLTKS